MLDAKYFRDELEQTAERLNARGFNLDVASLRELEAKRKTLQVRTEELQSQRNARSKAIGQAKAKGEDIQPLLDAVGDLGEQLESAKLELNELQHELQQ